MRILILLPEGQLHRLEVGPFIKMSFREAPLTATTLASLVPLELGADITVVDESVSKIPFGREFDIVGISVMTGTSKRAYELARIFREKGSMVVLGGVHVTLLPDEAKKHADSIVVGFAEQEWPRLLRDFAAGRLKQVYEGKDVNLENLPIPRRDLQKKIGYMAPNTVYATRGCRLRCEFCSVPAANFGWHKRPIPDVIREIKAIKSQRFVFNDVHMTDDPDYAKELCRALIPLNKKWGGLASTKVAKDDELLDLLYKSGCSYLLLGFESVDNKALEGINKRINDFSEYKMVVEKLHEKKIIIQGCFVLGMDGEEPDIFRRTVEIVNDLRIDIPRYAFFTPYPETDAFRRLEREGRLLHKNWKYYDTQHVVFRPDRMTPQQLEDGFKWAVRETFKISSIRKRLKGSGSNFYISFVGNLAYRKYIRKLMNDMDRFPAGVDPSVNINPEMAVASSLC
ncbi:MAG: radical SAM protein [Oligoflexales bacterium]|nr:radical SAM protein [Oligoflexales bacterium]